MKLSKIISDNSLKKLKTFRAVTGIILAGLILSAGYFYSMIDDWYNEYDDSKDNTL